MWVGGFQNKIAVPIFLGQYCTTIVSSGLVAGGPTSSTELACIKLFLFALPLSYFLRWGKKKQTNHN
jgi:hypothetical protein